MPEGDVETVHREGRWINIVEGARSGPDTTYELRVEHIVRNLDGTIGERSSYGHDLRQIPG